MSLETSKDLRIFSLETRELAGGRSRSLFFLLRDAAARPPRWSRAPDIILSAVVFSFLFHTSSYFFSSASGGCVCVGGGVAGDPGKNAEAAMDPAMGSTARNRAPNQIARESALSARNSNQKNNPPNS